MSSQLRLISEINFLKRSPQEEGRGPGYCSGHGAAEDPQWIHRHCAASWCQGTGPARCLRTAGPLRPG